MNREKLWQGNVLDKILDIFYPEDCSHCEAPISFNKGRYLCTKCLEMVEPLTEKNSCHICASKTGLHVNKTKDCPECRGKKFDFTRAISCALYESPIKKVIHLLKYENVRHCAKPLGYLLANRIKDIKEVWNSDCIIPVPLHKKRLKERGYNQAEELANILSKEINKPLDKSILIRVKDTPPQATLKMSERITNPKGAFETTTSTKFKTCILVDDVITTGSTMSECALKLRQAGFRHIYALAVAR